jgi:phage gpG-like protein
MAITPEQNIVYLEQAFSRIEEGAAAAANAMARYIAEQVALNTLTQNKHAPGAYHKARPGAPPSTASGKLAKAMFHTPASGGLRASAIVGNDDKRARVLEFGGCVLRPTRSKVMHWVDSAGSWYHRVLPMGGEQPEHPFLGPTVDEAIDNGELTRVAIEAFRPYDP